MYIYDTSGNFLRNFIFPSSSFSNNFSKYLITLTIISFKYLQFTISSTLHRNFSSGFNVFFNVSINDSGIPSNGIPDYFLYLNVKMQYLNYLQIFYIHPLISLISPTNSRLLS